MIFHEILASDEFRRDTLYCIIETVNNRDRFLRNNRSIFVYLKFHPYINIQVGLLNVSDGGLLIN